MHLKSFILHWELYQYNKVIGIMAPIIVIFSVSNSFIANLCYYLKLKARIQKHAGTVLYALQ